MFQTKIFSLFRQPFIWLVLFLCILYAGQTTAAAKVIWPAQSQSIEQVDFETIYVAHTTTARVLSISSNIDGNLTFSPCTQCPSYNTRVTHVSALTLNRNISGNALSPGDHILTIDIEEFGNRIQTQSSFSVINTAPIVKIVYPTSGQTLSSNHPQLLAAAVQSTKTIENSQTVGTFQWFVDGNPLGLADSSVPLPASLTDGAHVATVLFTDWHGNMSEDTIQFNVQSSAATPFAAHIISHSDNQLIELHPTMNHLPMIVTEFVLDAVFSHPITTNPIDIRVEWFSSHRGLIGQGARLSIPSDQALALFSHPGSHVVTAIVSNLNTGDVVTDSITLQVQLPDVNVVLTSPLDSMSLQQLTAQDIQWTFYDKHGPIINNPLVTTTSLIQNNVHVTSNRGGILRTPFLTPSSSLLLEGPQTLEVSTLNYSRAIISDAVQVTIGSNNPALNSSLSIVSPSSNITVATMHSDPILFTAEAFDNQGVDISSQVIWNAAFGQQFEFLFDPINAYFASPLNTVSATLYDFATNSPTTVFRKVLTTNSRPEISAVVEPVNTLLTDSTDTFLFKATAIVQDEEPFPPIFWNGNHGSEHRFSLAPGISSVNYALVFDQEDQTDAIRVDGSPNNPLNTTTCNSTGTNTQYEWIDAVHFNSGLTSIYGNFPAKPFSLNSISNAGYTDHGVVMNGYLYTGDNQVMFVPGFSGSPYNEHWSLWMDFNNDGTFSSDELLTFTSGSAPVETNFYIPNSLKPGYYRARVSMSYSTGGPGCGTHTWGETDDFVVGVASHITDPNVASPRSPSVPPTYCLSQGTHTQYEWIHSTTINGVTNLSNNNNGYHDLTLNPIPLNRGSNSLVLEPGFNGGTYNEYWSVSIDLNQDGILGQDEVVYQGNDTTAISTNFQVPNNASTGETRLRVTMSYGSSTPMCGDYTYGETEDYTVNIQ